VAIPVADAVRINVFGPFGVGKLQFGRPTPWRFLVPALAPAAFFFRIQAVVRRRCFCRRRRGRAHVADFGFILCQSFQEALVFTTNALDRLLLLVDEIQQLLDRD
jgi:hypothetical protein